jgi:hypothetical protein
MSPAPLRVVEQVPLGAVLLAAPQTVFRLISELGGNVVQDRFGIHWLHRNAGWSGLGTMLSWKRRLRGI